jgi:hypothetical protein
MVFFGDESLVLAGSFRHFCLGMPADIGVCHPVPDTGSSGVSVVSYMDAESCPSATSTRCAARQITTVILSVAEGSAFFCAKHVSKRARKLGPRTSERRSPVGRPAKAPRGSPGKELRKVGACLRQKSAGLPPGIGLHNATNATGPRFKPGVTASINRTSP